MIHQPIRLELPFHGRSCFIILPSLIRFPSVLQREAEHKATGGTVNSWSIQGQFKVNSRSPHGHFMVTSRPCQGQFMVKRRVQWPRRSAYPPYPPYPPYPHTLHTLHTLNPLYLLYPRQGISVQLGKNPNATPTAKRSPRRHDGRNATLIDAC